MVVLGLAAATNCVVLVKGRKKNMKFSVRVHQDDVSVKTWTLTRLLNYLRLVLRHQATITVQWKGTRVVILRHLDS